METAEAHGVLTRVAGATAARVASFNGAPRAIDAGIRTATLLHPWNREICETEDVICAPDWPELARRLQAPLLSTDARLGTTSPLVEVLVAPDETPTSGSATAGRPAARAVSRMARASTGSPSAAYAKKRRPKGAGRRG